MKRTVLLLIAILAYYYSNAQNTPWSTSGSIGIGTTAPMSAFQVLGIATLESLTLGYGTNPAIITTDDNTKPISFQIAGTEFMRLNKNGYVGIGTTAPGAALDVATFLNPGTLGTVLARLPEGNSSGVGTYLGVKGYNTQLNGNITNINNVVSFAIEHSFYGVTNSSINFLRGGGTSGGSISFNTNNNTEVMRLLYNGNVLIGKTTQANSSYMFDVAGTARANAIIVNSGGADFVFEPKYKLNSLPWLAKYINQNHHLPEIASAKQMQADGLNLGDNQIKLLQKVEELTLYLIEKDKKQKEDENKLQSQQIEIKSQQEEINLLKQQVQSLIKTVNKYQTN